MEDNLEVQEVQESNKLSIKDIGDFSDGNYTMNELYHHRMMLFSIICKLYKDVAWKSFRDSEGNGVDHMFMAGVSTPRGEFAYRFSDECYRFFEGIAEFERAPKFQYTDDYSILLSLINDK